MNKQELFTALWQKYLDDEKMSANEIRQLRTLIHDSQIEPYLDQSVTALFMEQTESYVLPETNTTDIFNATWEKLNAAELTTSDNIIALQQHTRRGWKKWAVAAALILITAGAASFWLFREQIPGKIARQQTGEPDVIKPGSDKAILTLADGSTITLNDAQNGELAKQGNTQVLKLANGQLAYQQQAGAATASLFNSIATPRGGRYHITLPDGSKVWLNAASSLRYPTAFNEQQREVMLSGEAYFEIAEKPAQPFVVKLENMQVQVLGTRFNIMAYADEDAIQTTLLQGKVSVNATTPANTGKQKILLPGQCASLSQNGTFKILNDVNTEEAIAWKNDLIQFAGTDLRAAMRMIARWYDVEVEYKGNVPDAHFRGSLSSGASIEQLLNMMQQTGEVHFQTAGRKIIVSP